ncbi:MAG: tautomerase family protein [Deltaproteobacteria bacterium]|nr:tautomerase family protein [Deltaproteobacteria bacterium]
MPIVTLKMFPRDVETKRQLSEGITKVVADITKNKPEMVHVIFEEISKENWSRGATLAIDRK